MSVRQNPRNWWVPDTFFFVLKWAIKIAFRFERDKFYISPQIYPEILRIYQGEEKIDRDVNETELK